MTTLAFELEWLDQVSKIKHTVYLKYFVDDNTLELVQDKAVFLKRIFYPEITTSDLFIGSSFTIHKRLYFVRNYANPATERYMQSIEVHALCSVESVESLVPVFSVAKSFQLTPARVKTSRDGTHLIEFVGLSGSTNAESFADAVSGHASVNLANASEAMNLFRSISVVRPRLPSSLCIVKPHILKSNELGDLVASIIENDFLVVGMISVHLSVEMADEMMNVYRDIYKPYTAMMDQLCSGPSLAIMVSSTRNPETVVEDFRELVGPLHPELAKVLYPKSIRGQFGVDLNRNAVHCTDLAEDADMECRYLFETIASVL